MAKKCEHDRTQCAVCSPEKVFRQYAYKAKQRNLTFSLTLQEFETLTGAACHWCGEWPSNGIDRVDNRIGYNSLPGQCVGCCMDCNMMKRNMLANKFLYRAERIAKHQEKLRKKTELLVPAA